MGTKFFRYFSQSTSKLYWKKVNEEIKRHKEFVQIVSNNLKKIKLPVIWTSSILPNDSVYGFFDYKFKLSYEISKTY